MAIKFQSVIPILRIFDVPKAEEFYHGFLGFSVDWDHRYDANTPLYRQISRGELVLHLSEHHGDGSPGAHFRVMMDGLNEYHRELISKNYRYMKPGLEGSATDGHEISVIDPFGNRITFCQDNKKRKESSTKETDPQAPN
jgi:hypothetical protein